MSLITAAALASGLFFPADAGAPPQHPVILALNPQPEPPGKAKVKRIYTGGPDSRRDKVLKSKQPMKQTPATKY